MTGQQYSVIIKTKYATMSAAMKRNEHIHIQIESNTRVPGKLYMRLLHSKIFVKKKSFIPKEFSCAQK